MSGVAYADAGGVTRLSNRWCKNPCPLVGPLPPPWHAAFMLIKVERVAGRFANGATVARNMRLFLVRVAMVPQLQLRALVVGGEGRRLLRLGHRRLPCAFAALCLRLLCPATLVSCNSGVLHSSTPLQGIATLPPSLFLLPRTRAHFMAWRGAWEVGTRAAAAAVVLLRMSPSVNADYKPMLEAVFPRPTVVSCFAAVPTWLQALLEPSNTWRMCC